MLIPLIVPDASALIELLFRTKKGIIVEQRIFSKRSAGLAAPHIVDLEILQVIRRLVQTKKIKVRRAEEALADFSDLQIERYPHESFLHRIWELRENLTAYDASYVALSESMNAVFLTLDSKLTKVPRIKTRVELIT